MANLNHAAAAGPDLREAALHLSTRLGFTLCRGDHEHHLRILFGDGYLDLLGEPEAGEWHWSAFSLASAQGAQPEVILHPRAFPSLGQPLRPQAGMEPERARAAVIHANTAIALAGVMVMVPEAHLAETVQAYERLTGVQAGAPFSDSALGVTGQTIPLANGQRISVVAASMGTGPAARFAVHAPAGVFAVVVRVGSIKAAADCLRNGSVYSYRSDEKLVTSSALPGFGGLIFEEAP